MLGFLPFLTGCGTYFGSYFGDHRTPTDLNKSTMVVRGQWSGVFTSGPDTDKALSLVLIPVYVSENEYAVTGTGTLGTEAVTAKGTVSGGGQKYIRSQSSPIQPAIHDLTIVRGDGGTLVLNCDLYGDVTVYTTARCGASGTQAIELNKVAP